MKHLLIPLVPALLFIACSNNKTTEQAGGALAAKETSVPAVADKPAGMTGCSSFIWFKEGTTLIYNLSDVSGKVTATTATHIDNVHNDGDALVADFTSVYGAGKSISASYRCAGDKLYMNMKSFFDNNFAGFKKAGMQLEAEDAFLSFPWSMKAGDSLDGASFVIKTKKDGKDFMSVTSTIKDRRVEGTEKISTPAGAWDCLRLSQLQSTSTTVMGRAVPARDTKTIEWFAPAAGLVKMEMYDANGKLSSRSELVAIKQ